MAGNSRRVANGNSQTMARLSTGCAGAVAAASRGVGVAGASAAGCCATTAVEVAGAGSICTGMRPVPLRAVAGATLAGVVAATSGFAATAAGGVAGVVGAAWAGGLGRVSMRRLVWIGCVPCAGRASNSAGLRAAGAAPGFAVAMGLGGTGGACGLRCSHHSASNPRLISTTSSGSQLRRRRTDMTGEPIDGALPRRRSRSDFLKASRMRDMCYLLTRHCATGGGRIHPGQTRQTGFPDQ